MTELNATAHHATAVALVEAAALIIDTASNTLATRSVENGRISVDLLDRQQIAAYDLAHAASAVAGSQVMLAYALHGEFEARLSFAYIADVIADLESRIFGRQDSWGVDAVVLAPFTEFVSRFRSPEFLELLADDVMKKGTGPAHLDDEFDLVRDTFHRFANDKIRPVAEHIHRNNEDIPESILQGMAEIGGFGLSVPEEYGGFAAGGESDYLAMCVATEELSWGSLGAGGALITRPEILTRAIVRGGTEEQKHGWLPQIASGERIVGVMVTEPDFGSDVAGVNVMATPDGDGYAINGVKTWCTFAGRADTIMLLARTDTDRSKGHRGLSVFVVEKPPATGHSFAFEDGLGGKMEGRAIDTLGYRGMHSYEVAFNNWHVPAGALIGGESGLGKGFYFQMEGFENGRLQTAARAVGLMQAAFEAGLAYTLDRRVFGKPVFEYQLTKAKLARMAALICAGRQFSYEVSRMMARGEGALEASMVKAYVCRAAEWVTREAMQLHGGMGYAEEYDVSRYFVDARVLSIFEGADETLCLRVIARRLTEQALEA
ncbi:acyl-CoA dehydrogenase [Actinobacteria bacterium IMCC26256]|nr:acyl-CoA dehydrogenase [Actinobacteria bacterium IMCC26256]